MDTSPTAFVRRLELLGTYAAQMAMATRAIVEAVDVVGQVSDRELSVLVDLLLDAFLLQAAEEGFGDGVVPAIALAAHRRQHSIADELLLKVVPAVLTAAIRMVNQSRLRPAPGCAVRPRRRSERNADVVYTMAYRLTGDDVPQPVSPRVPDHGTAACWVVITGQTAFVVNTVSATISSYQIGANAGIARDGVIEHQLAASSRLGRAPGSQRA